MLVFVETYVFTGLRNRPLTLKVPAPTIPLKLNLRRTPLPLAFLSSTALTPPTAVPVPPEMVLLNGNVLDKNELGPPVPAIALMYGGEVASVGGGGAGTERPANDCRR
jgi:hypothetical protein